MIIKTLLLDRIKFIMQDKSCKFFFLSASVLIIFFYFYFLFINLILNYFSIYNYKF